jgi:hypothetical protein
MKGALALAVTVGVLLGSLLWATITDMFKDELRTRLGQLPYWLIRMASLRIPADADSDLVEEWETELDVILHDTEGLPLTWLLRGVTFAADLLLRGAPAAAQEIGAGKTANELAPVLASDSKGAALPAWSDLFPEGRDIFYEGNDPVGFVRQIQSEFGFSPASDPRWGERIDGDGLSFTSHSFYCPSEHLDAIYGNNRFPVGS